MTLHRLVDTFHRCIGDKTQAAVAGHCCYLIGVLPLCRYREDIHCSYSTHLSGYVTAAFLRPAIVKRLKYSNSFTITRPSANTHRHNKTPDTKKYITTCSTASLPYSLVNNCSAQPRKDTTSTIALFNPSEWTVRRMHI